MSIEDFAALNIVHIAIDRQRDNSEILENIVKQHNQRLKDAETDMSLQIEVR
jgi:hypothetical protein